MIDTGLKNANIRYEIKDLTTFDPKKTIRDQVILDAVSAAMDREVVRLKKRGEKKARNAEVHSVQRHEKSERQEGNKRDGAIQARLAKQDKDIEGLTTDVCEVKTLLKDLVEGKNGGGDNRHNDGGDGNRNDGNRHNGNHRDGNRHDGNRRNNIPCCNHRCGDGDGNGHDGDGRNGGQDGGRRGGNYRRGGRGGYRGGNRGTRCAQCVNDNVARCVHCFHCFSHAHRYADCPEKN